MTALEQAQERIDYLEGRVEELEHRSEVQTRFIHSLTRGRGEIKAVTENAWGMVIDEKPTAVVLIPNPLNPDVWLPMRGWLPEHISLDGNLSEHETTKR